MTDYHISSILIPVEKALDKSVLRIPLLILNLETPPVALFKDKVDFSL